MTIGTTDLLGFDNLFSLIKPREHGEAFIFRDIKSQRTRDKFEVTFNIPGYSEEDVSVEVGGGFLAIEIMDGEKQVLSQTYSIPRASELDMDKATAKVKNGVLTVVIPAKGRKKIL